MIVAPARLSAENVQDGERTRQTMTEATRSDADAARAADRGASLVRYLCLSQGLYYSLTGIWPLLSIETFQMVTGGKTDHLVTGREADHWLVMTVGVLVTSIGVTLLVAARRAKQPAEVAVLAISSAVGLTAIDVVYVVRRVILPIYLLDAAVEIILLFLWIVALRRGPPA